MTETKKHLLILLVLGAVLFFIGNASIAITDPVESNYTLTSAEMFASGDYLSPRIYGNFWYDKPVFFYWELIAAFKVFGINEFAARFFPALAGIAGLFMVYGFARKIYDAKTGLFSALILGTSFEYWLISKTVITDLTLFLFFNAVLVFFYLAYTSQNKNYYYLCYGFAGLAVLTKGPIGILLPGLIVTVFILCRRDYAEIKRMKWLGGTVIFLIVGGSWYYLMYQLHGQVFLDTFLGIHNVLRATVSEHPKFNVWYYYLAIFFLGFFPWCFSLPMAIRKYWKKRQWPVLDQTTLFLLLWAVLVNGFYQCMATKYATYTLPALMPVAILTARLLYTHERFVRRLVAFNVFFYLALTFFVAIPLCNNSYSGRNVAAVLQEQVQPGDLVASYGDYKASAVFYSNQVIYNLVHADQIEKAKPKAMSWSSKNVMPFLSFEELPRDRNIYIIWDEHKKDDFAKEFKTDEWTPVEKLPKATIYYRRAQ
ncbi:dolichyl-phosphate-mannose-protein mannosyltransferase [Anaerospora hongkongensis]|uniref:Dolichyl-phosphate-mannose-protein mannosyltransferase n=1 Tax=Anaerospora hongkongensis TaxID=244830 RepID=A0A4R1Q2I4_9FIRM|nr:glycosyltransferase family 39 protein [Anaerospora hongkongensis]TCL38698.1 dolichyl-phosphate-mannose-protein mannosyltransferase [Anaerospora hongkongensis]